VFTGSPLLWTLFNITVIGLLIFDLGVLHRKSKEIPVREALIQSVIWIALSLLFNLGLYLAWGPQKGLQFLTGYLLELSLSVDNLFVFILLFSYFHVPRKFQFKVLFWGIIGVLITRATFILAGIGLIHRFHWVIYVFGAVLIISGIRMMREKDKEVHPEKNPFLNFLRRILPVTRDYVEDRFFVKDDDGFKFTPLFIALLTIELTDVIFATDSIPAILSITRDSFIVYSSNICAILGLRSLYFALSGIMGLFRYLNYGLAVILVFIGLKMIGERFIEIPVTLALGVILGVLTVSILASIFIKPKDVTAG